MKMTGRDFSGSITALAAASVLTAGCGFTGDTGDASLTESQSQGLVLAVQAEDLESGVASFRYAIDRVSCNGEDIEPFAYDATVDLLGDLELPGGIGDWENAPFHEDSGHAFADHYVVLETGCYDVSVEPLDDVGDPVTSCTTAARGGVEVLDGQTTEILLISQCDGAATGGLDVVASVNVAPTITALTYHPSKFVDACVPVEICVTATDPDGDPIDFGWSSDHPDATPTPTSVIRDGNSVTACVSLDAPATATVQLGVTAFDLMFDDQGNIARAQDITGADSHDTLDFPLYVSDDDSACCQPITCAELKLEPGTSLSGGDATLVIPDGACPFEVSLTSYMLPGGQKQPYSDQVVFDHLTATYGPGTHQIQVGLPDCSWQSDLYCGPLVCLNQGVLIGNRKLDWDDSTGDACGPQPPSQWCPLAP